ncbi:unnamed protein product [Trichobilharzia regenti]|nr:unnamed protein product [Trichobilharzia regenti]
MDNVYDILHRKLNNHFDSNSIQFDICLKQLMNIDERLSTIHSLMMTPLNIDFTNDGDDDAKNNVILLINNHDVNFYDQNLPSIDHLLSLLSSSLMSTFIGDNLRYNLNNSLTTGRREFLSRYYVLSKEFLDKINYVKFQLDNSCITDNILSPYPSNSISIHNNHNNNNNNDSVGLLSHSPSYSSVQQAMLALKHCLESRYEQLKVNKITFCFY